MIIFRGWELKVVQDIMGKTFRNKIDIAHLTIMIIIADAYKEPIMCWALCQALQMEPQHSFHSQNKFTREVLSPATLEGMELKSRKLM